MKIYIYCPWIVTGGPEALHQLCHTLNDIGYESYIIYYDHGYGIGDNLYGMYYRTKIATEYENMEDNLVIFPEVYCSRIYNKGYKTKLMMWWLSYDNGIDEFNNVDQFKNYKIYYGFQSYYAYVKMYDIIKDNKFLLFEYIRPNIVDAGYFIKDKQNIVAINERKDKESKRILIENNIDYISLERMNEEDLIRELKKCKIYVDFGTHPGKDRLPREAAALGCVVITNKEGSANYSEDIYIKEKLDDVNDLTELINKIFKDYEYYLYRQHEYRNNIIREEMVFRDQLKILIKYIETN
jgi:hypothetical protein